MRPVHYAVLISVLACGMASSVWLIPGQSDLGLMRLKERQYASARQIYETRLAAGERSADVIMPLAEIYLQLGDVDRALDLLGQLSGDRSDRYDLLLQVARFQKYGERQQDYLRSLEAMNRVQSSPEGLRDLANLYRYANRSAELAATLQALTAKSPEDPLEFLELANLLAIAGRTPEAAQVMNRFEALFPRAVTADSVELLVSLLLDSGQKTGAFERAERWLSGHRDPNGVIRFAEQLRSKGQENLAARLLTPFEDALDRSPVLLAEWTQLQAANGREEDAFQRLDRLRREKTLPEDLWEPYLDLALARNQFGLAVEVAEERGLRSLPGRLLTALAERALAEGRQPVAQRMAALLGTDYLRAKPLLAARLAYSRGGRDEAARWLRFAETSANLTDADRLAVASLDATLGRPEEAFAQISQLRLEFQPEPVLLEIARLYVNLGKSRDGVERFDRLRAGRSIRNAEKAWSLVAAGAGRGQEVARWLDSERARAVPTDLLRDLYFIALEQKEAGLSLETARRMLAEDSSDANRLLLANALIAAGQPAEALPHLRLLLARGQRDELDATYAAALLGAIHGSPEGTATQFQMELRNFWSAKLRASGQDERQRLDLIYGLLDIQAWDDVLPQLEALARQQAEFAPLYIETAAKVGRQKDVVAFLRSELDRNTLPREAREARLYALMEYGGSAEALPYIRQMATDSAATWIPVYEETLQKLVRHEELLAFWRERAGRSAAPPDEKRSIAFKLIDAGHQDWARSIFMELARSAKPDAPDVAELLFLSGSNPGPDVKTWLEDRARLAPGADRAAWLGRLLDAGAPERVDAVVSAALPPPGQGGAVLEVYLRALAALGKNRPLGEAVAREAPAVHDSERVRTLARLARDAGQTSAAEPVYRRLLALAPGDREARHWLGIYAFGLGRYLEAERYLGGLLGSAEGDYDDNFYYAEMLWREGDRETAKIYYGRALGLIKRMVSPPLEARIASAQAMFRLGFGERSLQEFRQLIAENPRNGELRADFVVLLLENKLYAEAWNALSGGADSGVSRLALLRAQWLFASARTAEALELLRGLIASEPNPARAQTKLGLIEQSIGRTRQARDLFETAVQLEPGNEDFEQTLAGLDREQAPQVQVEGEARTIQGSRQESLISVLAERTLAAFHVQFAFDQDSASIRSLRFADGRVGAFNGVRERGEASVEREWMDGRRVKVSVFEGGSKPGAGAAVTQPDAKGATTIALEINRPFWEFNESLAQDGARDHAEIRHETTLGRRLSARFGVAWNRYNLKPAPGAAETAAPTGGATFRLAERPQLALEYYFDGEYRLSIISRPDASGKLFEPLPLLSREVHGAGLSFTEPIGSHAKVSGASGMAVDRLGGYAPFLNFKVAYEPRGHFSASLDFDRRLYFLNSAQTVTTVKGGLSWRF